MSFLNPVNEPVLRFKSTDAGAPQINYNARTAGDVKAVLKACLVTGYGDTASAGWSVVNEVGHVAEFVSPSASMSDYRLGIDDTSTSSTTWYYQYQDVRTNPSYNTPTKSFSYADKTHLSNGWELLVTDRGLFFLEHIFNNYASDMVARVTYIGSLKLAINNTGINICFFNAGHNGSSTTPSDLFTNKAHTHLRISDQINLQYFGSIATTGGFYSDLQQSHVDFISKLHITNGFRVFIAQHPGLLTNQVNNPDDIFGSEDVMIDSRPALKVCLGTHSASVADIARRSCVVLIRLDSWSY